MEVTFSVARLLAICPALSQAYEAGTLTEDAAALAWEGAALILFWGLHRDANARTMLVAVACCLVSAALTGGAGAMEKKTVYITAESQAEIPEGAVKLDDVEEV